MRPLAGTLLVALVFLAACGGGCNNGKPFTMERLFGPPPAKMIAMAFDVEDPDKRREGILALSKRKWGLREPHLKGYARILRSDHDATVRCAAVRALGKAGNVKYLDEVIQTLDDDSAAVRWDAALALADVRGPSAEEPLIQCALNDLSPDVRSACAQTLSHYQSREVIQTLVKCMDDQSIPVQFSAHASLVEIVGIDMGMESRDWRAVVEQPLFLTPRERAKPWWDLMGVTRPKSKPPPATTQPAP